MEIFQASCKTEDMQRETIKYKKVINRDVACDARHLKKEHFELSFRKALKSYQQPQCVKMDLNKKLETKKTNVQNITFGS